MEMLMLIGLKVFALPRVPFTRPLVADHDSHRQ